MKAVEGDEAGFGGEDAIELCRKRNLALFTRSAAVGLDLRAVDRHPLASVGSLVLGLRFTLCRGGAPMPKITGLRALPRVASTNESLSSK